MAAGARRLGLAGPFTARNAAILLGASAGRLSAVRKLSARPSVASSLASPWNPICPERSNRRKVAMPTPLRWAKSSWRQRKASR